MNNTSTDNPNFETCKFPIKLEKKKMIYFSLSIVEYSFNESVFVLFYLIILLENSIYKFILTFHFYFVFLIQIDFV